MELRAAIPHDQHAIDTLYRCAFPADEGARVAKLAIDLLGEPQALALVADDQGSVVGHIAFSPVTISGDDDRQGALLAPLAVMPSHQRRGIGSRLVQSGLERLSTLDITLLFVYGDPDYYGKFGFSAATAAAYIPPYTLQYPFGWQGLALDGRNLAQSAVNIGCVAPLRDPALW